MLGVWLVLINLNKGQNKEARFFIFNISFKSNGQHNLQIYDILYYIKTFLFILY